MNRGAHLQPHDVAVRGHIFHVCRYTCEKEISRKRAQQRNEYTYIGGPKKSVMSQQRAPLSPQGVYNRNTCSFTAESWDSLEHGTSVLEAMTIEKCVQTEKNINGTHKTICKFFRSHMSWMLTDLGTGSRKHAGFWHRPISLSWCESEGSVYTQIGHTHAQNIQIMCITSNREANLVCFLRKCIFLFKLCFFLVKILAYLVISKACHPLSSQLCS